MPCRPDDKQRLPATAMPIGAAAAAASPRATTTVSVSDRAPPLSIVASSWSATQVVSAEKTDGSGDGGRNGGVWPHSTRTTPTLENPGDPCRAAAAAVATMHGHLQAGDCSAMPPTPPTTPSPSLALWPPPQPFCHLRCTSATAGRTVCVSGGVGAGPSPATSRGANTT